MVTQQRHTGTRRSIVAGLLAGGLAAVVASPANRLWAKLPSPPTRIVALDWTATAMLLSLGVHPIGVGDAGLYRRWVAEPMLPPATPDVGMRDAPNPEIIVALNPDLILVSPLGAASRPLLERIAPTHEISLQRGKGDALVEAEQELMALGALLGREVQAADVIASSRALFAALSKKLSRHAAKNLLVIQFFDNRFVRVYGRSSIPGSVLDRLGLANMWTLPVNGWGYALVGIEKLAGFADADIVVVEPVPTGLSLAPDSRSLWGNLPAVRQGRIHRLPPVWTFGEVTAANRFASLVSEYLQSGGVADAPL